MIFLRKVLVLLALFLFVVCAGRAESPDSLPKPTTYVADFAGVIDASSKQSLEAYCLQVYTKAHATIVVVTIKSLDGLQIDDFTTQLQSKWRVGPKKTDRGIIMVIAVQDHKWRIEVGYGLEGILNDAKAGDMGRDMVPQLKEGQYGPAALLGVQELGNVIASDAGVTLDAPAPVQHTYHREAVRRSRGSSWPVWIFVALFVFSLLGRRRSGGGGGFPWWLFFLNGIGGGGGGGRSGWDNDDRGGGSGGGSSGGSDFGGGFGGDSGGGGASGDW